MMQLRTVRVAKQTRAIETLGRAWAVRSGGGNNVDGEVLYSLEAN